MVMKMTKKEMLDKAKEIKKLANEDVELAHIKCDKLMEDILVENGFGDVVSILESFGKWYA